jgi:hypothetical protein
MISRNTYTVYYLSFISKIILDAQTRKLWKHKNAFVKESCRKGVLVGRTTKIRRGDHNKSAIISSNSYRQITKCWQLKSGLLIMC